MATYQFQTEVNQLLKLIIHSMYSNKDIFLREIVSNASDALDKLKYLTVSDDAFKDVHFAPRIDISFEGGDEGKESVLTVQDSGIGMTDKDLTDNHEEGGYQKAHEGRAEGLGVWAPAARETEDQSLLRDSGVYFKVSA